jgi:ribosome-binding protein aMBF1 (putative translation factor)
MITYMKSNALEVLKSTVEAHLDPEEIALARDLEVRLQAAAFQRKLGRLVKEERTARGWSQRDLSKSLGISQREICHIEQGKSNPTLTTQVKILSVLGLKLEITAQ